MSGGIKAKLSLGLQASPFEHMCLLKPTQVYGCLGSFSITKWLEHLGITGGEVQILAMPLSFHGIIAK